VHGAGGAARDHADELAIPEDAAAEVVDELPQGEADARLVQARLLHVTAHAEDAGAPVVEGEEDRKLAQLVAAQV
jgi:hypothetical protein